MSRDSSPALVDPFADTQIQAAIRALPEPHHSWRRALPGASDLVHVRAKSIRLGETARPSLSRENHVTTSRVASIEGNGAAAPGAVRHGTIAQLRELTDMDRKVLAAIRDLGGFASAKEIHARVTGASLFVVRSRLDRLVADGRVRSVPGQGYAIEETR